MHILKKDFEKEIKGLEKLYEEIDDLRKEIRTLRDQLFSGTSVLESRKSVELSAVTILQGHNIKLLTLVSIFFLPLTFVTSVFGMTNMSTDHNFKDFAIVMAVVCVPFFFLIGSLNTTSGMTFWRNKWHTIINWLTSKTSVLGRGATKEPATGQNDPEAPPKPRERTYSTSRSMAARAALVKEVISPSSPRVQGSRRATSSNSNTHPPNLGAVSTITVFDSDSGHGKEAETRTAISPPEKAVRDERRWREIIFGRERAAKYDHNV